MSLAEVVHSRSRGWVAFPAKDTKDYLHATLLVPESVLQEIDQCVGLCAEWLESLQQKSPERARPTLIHLEAGVDSDGYCDGSILLMDRALELPSSLSDDELDAILSLVGLPDGRYLVLSGEWIESLRRHQKFLHPAVLVALVDTSPDRILALYAYRAEAVESEDDAECYLDPDLVRRFLLQRHDVAGSTGTGSE